VKFNDSRLLWKDQVGSNFFPKLVPSSPPDVPRMRDSEGAGGMTFFPLNGTEIGCEANFPDPSATCEPFFSY